MLYFIIPLVDPYLIFEAHRNSIRLEPSAQKNLGKVNRKDTEKILKVFQCWAQGIMRAIGIGQEQSVALLKWHWPLCHSSSQVSRNTAGSFGSSIRTNSVWPNISGLKLLPFGQCFYFFSAAAVVYPITKCFVFPFSLNADEKGNVIFAFLVTNFLASKTLWQTLQYVPGVFAEYRIWLRSEHPHYWISFNIQSIINCY